MISPRFVKEGKKRGFVYESLALRRGRKGMFVKSKLLEAD